MRTVNLERLLRPVIGNRVNRGGFAVLDCLEYVRYAISLIACQAQRLAILARQKLQRKHAHSHQIRAVDSLEALRDHGLHAEQQDALRRPVAGGTRAVLLAGDDHERNAVVRDTSPRRHR